MKYKSIHEHIYAPATTPSFLHTVHRCWKECKWELACPIIFWRQGAAPPGVGPADRASHLGRREPATGPSIPAPCPLGLQPARQAGRAGGDKRSSLTRQAGACFDDSSVQWGQRRVRLTLFNAMAWFHPAVWQMYPNINTNKYVCPLPRYTS